MKIVCVIVMMLMSVSACKGEVGPGGDDPGGQLPYEAPIVDLVLIYGGGAHRNVVWNEDHFAPYVSYTDRNAEEHLLFDGFLLLEFVDGRGKIFATGYNGTPAAKKEWKALADYYFTPGRCVDALNKCIGKKIQTLGAPEQKRKVIIALPEPIVAGPSSHYKNTPADYWGEINGKKLDFTVQQDRVTACMWYINYVTDKFEAGKFDNLELDGFYWIAEETLHTGSILPDVGAYLSGRDYSFNWIPYWKTTPDYYTWRALGFHSAWLQPNYFFNDNVPYSRLNDACRVARDYNLDLELEFDMRVFPDKGDRSSRLYDYMRAFRGNGVLTDKRIAYYQDCDALYHLWRATDEKSRAVYHDFCAFVREHQSKYVHGK